MVPKFSIIVPIYNTPKDFVKQCIDSIVAQSYIHWECIVVDDCSDIEYAYLFTDERIRYIKQEKNQGVFAAYRDGFKKSTGDYVIHCDSDDWLSPEYLQHVIDVFDPKYDAYLMNTVTVFDEHYKEKAIWPNKGLCSCSGQEWFDSLCDRRQTSWAFWGKTLKHSLLKKVYDTLNVTEKIIPSYDCLLILACSLFSREVKYVPFNAFFYRINPHGVTYSAVTKQKLFGILSSEELVVQHLLKLFKKENIEDSRLDKIRQELGKNFIEAFYQNPGYETICAEIAPRVMRAYGVKLAKPRKTLVHALFPKGSEAFRFIRLVAMKIYRIVKT